MSGKEQLHLSTAQKKSRVGRPKGTGTQRVYDRVRDSILKLKLAPGADVNEASLEEEFGVSRTPVREALIRLASEGLITLLPNQGARVSSIELSDISQMFEMLELTQRAVTRWCAARRDKADVTEMRWLSASFTASTRALDPNSMGEINRSFSFQDRSMLRQCVSGSGLRCPVDVEPAAGPSRLRRCPARRRRPGRILRRTRPAARSHGGCHRKPATALRRTGSRRTMSNCSAPACIAISTGRWPATSRSAIRRSNSDQSFFDRTTGISQTRQERIQTTLPVMVSGSPNLIPAATKIPPRDDETHKSDELAAVIVHLGLVVWCLAGVSN